MNRRLHPLAILFCALCFPIAGIGQSETDSTEQKTVEKKEAIRWKKKLVTGVTLNQNAYSNWAQGGQNSLSWTLRMEGEAVKNGENWGWNFSGIVVFGQTKQEKESTRTNTDKIDLDGSLIWKMGPHVNPYFGLSLLTQFARGFDYSKEPPEAKSAFWDPAILTQSLGARIKIEDVFNSQLGIGLKETMTRRYRQYSDHPDTEKKERLKFQTGIESKSNLNAKLTPNLQCRSKLELFSTFETLKKIDVRWDTLFTCHINKHVVVTLNVQVNYLKDVIDKIQLKEVLGIGISHNIF